MKRKIVICILIVLSFLSIAQMVDRNNNQTNSARTDTPRHTAPEQTTEEPSIEISDYESNYRFILLNDNGKVTVYHSDNVTVYLDTGISVDTLPQELQNQLMYGIRFTTEMELFEFLENYSS